MFVLAHTFKLTAASVPEITGEMVKRAGASISLTSLTNLIAFAIGSTIPLPAVSTFSKAATIVVAVNYVVIVFAFSAILALDAKRMKNGVSDCMRCCGGKGKPLLVDGAAQVNKSVEVFISVMRNTIFKIFVVCMYACMYVCMYLFLCVVCCVVVVVIGVVMCVCVYVMCVCVYVMCVCVYVMCVCVYVMCVCVYVMCVCVYVCERFAMCVFLLLPYRCVVTKKKKWTHTHTHTHTHKHTNTYIHTQLQQNTTHRLLCSWESSP